MHSKLISASDVDVVANYHCELGEGPLWHPLEERLYWTDILGGRIFQYDPISQQHKCMEVGRNVCGFTFERDGGLLLFMDRGAIALWRDGELRKLYSGAPSMQGTRFNDVIADPCGRVFCGVMPDVNHTGRLCRLDPDGSLRTLLEGLGCPNGMAFSLDRRTFFFTDSVPRTIYAFDYDEETGSLSRQRSFLTFEESEGLPDGLTMDSEGYLWTAFWGGGHIARISPDRLIVKSISIPTDKVTSLAFGGSSLDTLYVTSAGGSQDGQPSTLCGSLFQINPEVTGKLENFSRCSMSQIVEV
jgi:D-xylono/L-arabinono-1,4-lactonase